MKKILALCLSAVLACAIFTGCSTNKIGEDVKNEGTKAVQETEKLKDDAKKTWADVEGEFSKLEDEAKTEITNAGNVGRTDVQSYINTIETNYEKVKSGINTETEDAAKEMYKAGHALESLGEKAEGAVNHDVVKLGKDAKALVKNMYGEAEADLSTAKGDFENGLNNIKNYTEDKWTEFENLFR